MYLVYVEFDQIALVLDVGKKFLAVLVSVFSILTELVHILLELIQLWPICLYTGLHI